MSRVSHALDLIQKRKGFGQLFWRHIKQLNCCRMEWDHLRRIVANIEHQQSVAVVIKYLDVLANRQL